MVRRLVGSLSRTAGFALVSDGVVGVAVPDVHAERWTDPSSAWRKRVKSVVGDAAVTSAFAVAEVAAGVALVVIVPRLLKRK